MIINTQKPPEKVSWHQCPTAVRNYLDNVDYTDIPYTQSSIASYAPSTVVASNSKPISINVDGISYNKEIPNIETAFSSTHKAGTLKPLDRLRWINTTQAPNVRDIGGWSCGTGSDGQPCTVKYGMLFRGGVITSADRDVLVNQCGVRAELNLIGGQTAPSVLGNDIFFAGASSYNWYSLLDQNNSTATWVTNLTFLFEKAKYRLPIYFHCQQGADRTATFAVILEALLGMSQSDIDKDYEITSFAPNTTTVGETVPCMRYRTSSYKNLIDEINALYGTSFNQKVINWVGSLGFSEDDVNTLRANVIDGNPVTVHFTRTVTNLVETYQDDARFSSSGTIKSAEGLFVVTNYIMRESATNDVFRVKINGASQSDLTAMLSNTQLYIFAYKSDDGGQTFTQIKYRQCIGNDESSPSWEVVEASDGSYILQSLNTTGSIFAYASSYWNYFRIGLAGSGANCIITRNEAF